MRGVDRDGAEVETPVRYARSGVRSAGSTRRGRSLERDLLIQCGLAGGMDRRSIARAMGIARQSVDRRVAEVEAWRGRR